MWMNVALLTVAGFFRFLLMLADRYLRYQHYISRTAGYLEFYRKTRNIRRLPLMVNSGGKLPEMVHILTFWKLQYFPEHYIWS